MPSVGYTLVGCRRCMLFTKKNFMLPFNINHLPMMSIFSQVILICNINQSHWISCKINLKEWVIYIYDSIAHRTNMPDNRENDIMSVNAPFVRATLFNFYFSSLRPICVEFEFGPQTFFVFVIYRVFNLFCF